MRLGLIARADNGGLGAQTWELYKNLHPAKTLVVDISAYNTQHNQYGYDNHFERYTEGKIYQSVHFPDNQLIDEFLEDLDIVLTVETPYSYYLFDAARERGVKTVMQFNYEFLDYFLHPEWSKPDMLLAPSEWHLDSLKGNIPFSNESVFGTQLEYLPVPVNRKHFPFKQRKQAKTFLHIAGHRTYEDRNGTETIIDAIPLVQSDVRFVIRSQYEVPGFEHDYRVTVNIGDAPNYWELYRNEDVLLLPRKYGGLSLQLNEAISCGIIPLMLDIEPQNKFLHSDMLIPATFLQTIAPRTPIDVFECTPQQLAQKIDEFAQKPAEQIEELSTFCDAYAQTIDWDLLAPKYMELLEKCVQT